MMVRDFVGLNLGIRFCTNCTFSQIFQPIAIKQRDDIAKPQSENKPTLNGVFSH